MGGDGGEGRTSYSQQQNALCFGHAMPKPLLALAGGKAGPFWLCHHLSPAFVRKFGVLRNEKMPSAARVSRKVASLPLVWSTGPPVC